ncbi:F-box/LRR-repeat protein 20 [Rhodotorula toruloides]|nr:F-box/LRR-repeat protein 20 [Rhodotorula toruloides]
MSSPPHSRPSRGFVGSQVGESCSAGRTGSRTYATVAAGSSSALAGGTRLETVGTGDGRSAGHEGTAGGGGAEAGESTSGSTGSASAAQTTLGGARIEAPSSEVLDGLEAPSPSLPSSHPVTTPSAASSRPPPSATATVEDMPANASFSTPSRPEGRRSRLSSFKDRMTPYRPSSSGESEREGSRRRPGMKRRFSRSLTSLVSLVPPRSDEAADEAGDDEATKLSKWRAKGKAKLIKAFKPPQNPPGSSSRADGPGVDDDVFCRISSRSRSYSAPLFLPPHVLEADIASRRVPPISPPITHPRIEDDTARDESPFPSAFNTCPSSPVLDSGFASSTPNPAIATTMDPSSHMFELAEPDSEPDLFARLPREVQLRVFRGLLDVCEEEWRRDVKEGQWTGEKACDRWGDGRARGRRELVKMGRVCRLWRSLSLDGQLWSTAPAASLLGATSYSSASLLSLAVGAGGFVKTFDARGLGKSLDWTTLAWMIVPLDGSSDTGLTNLTNIDLTGCTSLTSASLTSLLSHSPHLLRLIVPSLRCVDNSHMATLGSSCPHLAHLDVSRCPNLRGPALQKLPHTPQPPQNTLSRPFTSEDLLGGLVTLKAAGLSGVNGSDLASFLSRHRRLATLDLSWCNGVTDNGLKLVVQQLTPSDSAARPSQWAALASTSGSKRVFPSLRHLNLSACHSVSTVGLSHLAGTVPNLEILELSRLGSRLRTDGLARLVASCPKLRKLDIEDAEQAGDDVLHALVGVGDATGAPNLEHLVISACTSLTDPAIAAVVRGCPKLRVLEADTTAISDRTAKEFVRLARERASQAQREAVSREGDVDPLVASKYPAVLSLLDNRQTGRRLSRDLGSANLRGRIGQRGYWTNVVGGYLDDDDSAQTQESPARKKMQAPLSECDESRVVVRSFYSNLAVDAALAVRETTAAKKRQEKAGGAGGEPRQGALRTRAMSDSEVLRRTDTGDDEDGRVACVVS